MKVPKFYNTGYTGSAGLTFWGGGGPPLSGAHLRLFGGKKKSQNKNFDNHITTIYLALTSTSSILTMEMFSSLDEFQTFCELKSGGAS